MHPPTTLAMTQALLGGRGGSLAHPRIPQHDGTGSWGAVGEAWRTRGSPSTMAQAPGGPWGKPGAPADPPARWHRRSWGAAGGAPPTWNEDCRMMSCQRIPRHAVAQGAAHDAATLLRR